MANRTQQLVIIETDSPYLAPIPMRGKKNEPAFLVYTARKIAELWNSDEATVARHTEANVTRLFGLA